MEIPLDFEKSGDAHYVVLRTDDSSVFVGGNDKNLSKYDKNFNIIGSLDL